MTEHRADPQPDEALRFVRASVANQCNLSCVYCPKDAGMENHVPATLRGRRLSTPAYQRVLDALADGGVIGGISFTGGEPTLNPDLPALVAHARSRYRRVELTTNGRKLPQQLDRLAPHLDVIKVSLDSHDRELSHQIMRGRPADHDRALDAIGLSLAAGLTVGVNVVVMRRNLNQIAAIIRTIADLHARAGAGTVYVSLLDLYYTPSTRTLWQQEFVPLDALSQRLAAELGGGIEQHRKGCVIRWFNHGGVQIRVKDSHESTFRGARCRSCAIYCQEGFYGLKLSVEGWLTPCPSGAEDLGVHLPANLSDQQLRERIAPLVHELAGTTLAPGSFNTFLARNDLRIDDKDGRTRLPLTVLPGGHR
ncbi:radical SAM protein [Micromonospora sp. CPCC 206061]|uniref:radical SAM protein n=1 Tax=Micromonospora sp. CPCC 206061 TaxID=3122410 RepID=UPI002FEFFD46